MFNSKKNFKEEIKNEMSKDLEYYKDSDSNSDTNLENDSDYDNNSNLSYHISENTDENTNYSDTNSDTETDTDDSDYYNTSDNDTAITNRDISTNSENSEENIQEYSDNSSDSSDNSSEEDVLLFQKHDYSIKDETNRLFHKFSEKPYYFLTEHKYTKKLKLDENITYNVQLFIHILCNNSENDPYLLFVQEYNKINNHYNIPKISYNLQIQTKNEDGYVDTMDLNNKIKEFIFRIFKISPEQIDETLLSDINDSLQGFYKKDDTIIAGINGIPYVSSLLTNTPILSHFFYDNIEHNVPNYCCTTIQNCLEFKEVYNIPISVECQNMLKSNKWLWEIKNSKGNTTELPIIMFSSGIKNDKIVLDKLNNAILPFRYETENLYMFTFSNKLVFKKEFFEKREIQEYIIFKNESLHGDINDINKLWEDNSFTSLDFSLNNSKCIGIISHKFFHKI